MVPKQLQLLKIEDSLKAAGIDELPEGISGLAPKEVKFVLELIRSGQMAKSATAAGYSADNAGPTATRILQRPSVLRFYRGCLQKVAESHNAILERAMQRAVLAHAKYIEAAQETSNAQELLFLAAKQESGKNAKTVQEFDTVYSRRQREESKYFKMAQDADGHLLQALGRAGINVNMSGGIDLKDPNNTKIPGEVLSFMANVRRQMQATPATNRMAPLSDARPPDN